MIMSTEEKDHVLTQLIRNNMSDEMARIFLLQKELNTEDIFEYAYMTNGMNFYINVFQFLGNYMYSKVRTKNFDGIASNIMNRLYLGNTNNERDTLIKKFITEILLSLIDNGFKEKAYYIISMLMKSELVNRIVLLEIIGSHKTLHSSYIIDCLLHSHEIDLLESLSLLEMVFINEGWFIAEEMFRKLILNEYTFLNVLEYVMNSYMYDFNSDVIVSSKYSGVKEVFFDKLATIMAYEIYVNSKIDMTTYLQEAIDTYSSEGNMYYVDIFSRILKHIESDKIKLEEIADFRNTGILDSKLELSNDEICSLRNDKFTLRFLTSIEDISSNKLLFRMINVTKYKFLNNDLLDRITIDSLKRRLYDSETDRANKLGYSNEIIAFIYFRRNQEQ